MSFTSCGGCLKDIFITEAEIIDRYVGNQLWSWGIGTGGQLGNNALTSRSSPVQTVSGGTNWKYVDTAGQHTAAIKTDGTLWLWGSGGAGRLGNNATTNQSSPVQTVSGGTNWKQVAAVVDNGRVGAIKTDGTLWLWGLGAQGALGTNSVVSQSSPVQTISGGTNWKQVSLAEFHSAAIKTDGTLWMWGEPANGKLGDNTTTPNRSSPIQTVSGGTNWKQVSVMKENSAAIKTDGTLWLWGSNGSGQLGDNTVASRSSPVQTVSGGTNWKQVSLGLCFAGAIKTDGTLWMWGSGNSGFLGDNTNVAKSSPVQTVSGGTNWKQVSLGCRHVGAVKTDGTLWIWGTGSTGELGDNSVISRSSPVQTISGGTNWKQVSSGITFTSAITFTEL